MKDKIKQLDKSIREEYKKSVGEGGEFSWIEYCDGNSFQIEVLQSKYQNPLKLCEMRCYTSEDGLIGRSTIKIGQPRACYEIACVIDKYMDELKLETEK